jgi:hypothetical protein
MGFRNHVLRTLLLLALALGGGIAVAILSGGERTRPVQGSSLPAVVDQTAQRLG